MKAAKFFSSQQQTISPSEFRLVFHLHAQRRNAEQHCRGDASAQPSKTARASEQFLVGHSGHREINLIAQEDSVWGRAMVNAVLGLYADPPQVAVLQGSWSLNHLVLHQSHTATWHQYPFAIPEAWRACSGWQDIEMSKSWPRLIHGVVHRRK
jgi:hypothetical protein